MICARCGKARGNCVGHEFDTNYGVKVVKTPIMPPSKICSRCEWRQTIYASGLCKQCLETRFRCGLCHASHWPGECSVRIAGVTIYGQR